MCQTPGTYTEGPVVNNGGPFFFSAAMSGGDRGQALVLVTRPEPAGTDLAARLREQGWDAHAGSPFALAGPSDPGRARRRLLAALPADLIIFTSAAAIDRAVELVGADHFTGWIMVPGAGTARAAVAAGLGEPRYPESGGTSEDLLGMPELDDPSGRKVLILAAAGGRRLLERTLVARGAEVSRVHVYRRVPAQLPESLEGSLKATSRVITLVSSGAALDGLAKKLSRQAWKRILAGALVAPSARLARRCRALGAARVIEAEGADEVAMVAALERLADESP